MTNYTCIRCGKLFKQKGHFNTHNARVRPCIQTLSLESLVEQKVREALAVKSDDISTSVAVTSMNYQSMSRSALLALCKERGIKRYSTKKKEDLIVMLTGATPVIAEGAEVAEDGSDGASEDTDIASLTDMVGSMSLIEESVPNKINRLNYIGSKFKLLEWITNNIKQKTGWTSFVDKKVSDLFAGTGIVSYHFRKLGASVISNDAELYSSIIVHAFTRSIFTDTCKTVIDSLQKSLVEGKYLDTVGFVTKHYSPYGECVRKFFTVDNAKRIDFIRSELELLKDTLSADDYKFILASILLSADAVSNVPAVYGCFLKQFKAKANKSLVLMPIHTITTPAKEGSITFNSDILNAEVMGSFTSDVVYLDPPYNSRQYSKNYFPLNIIAKTPLQLQSELPLKGVTGIPTDCFMSPFCKQPDVVVKAFEQLFSTLKTKWLFLSYNSESTVTKGKLLELMAKFGEVSVIEQEYKRFKSFEYNKDKKIQEYLFCLKFHD